jgi:hypothetical protein
VKNVEQLWKQIHDLSQRVISASCVFNYLSYLLSVISMSLLLRTALRYGMPLHQGYEIKHIIMCFIKQEERCKRSGI